MARIAFGEPDGSNSARVQKVAAILDREGIQIVVSEDITSALWTKLVTVASVGTAITAARASLVEFLNCPAGEDTLRSVMSEIVSVGESEGVRFPANVVEDRLAESLAEAPDVKSSLQMDLQAGNPLELDDLLGAVVAKGQANGVPVPASAALYSSLYKFRKGSGQ